MQTTRCFLSTVMSDQSSHDVRFHKLKETIQAWTRNSLIRAVYSSNSKHYECHQLSKITMTSNAMQHLNLTNYSESHQLLSGVTKQCSGNPSRTGDHRWGDHPARHLEMSQMIAPTVARPPERPMWSPVRPEHCSVTPLSQRSRSIIRVYHGISSILRV